MMDGINDFIRTKIQEQLIPPSGFIPRKMLKAEKGLAKINSRGDVICIFSF
jgi:hypothetical protein